MEHTELILSRGAAEAEVSRIASRRYKGKDADAIQAVAKEIWNKLAKIGRRAFIVSADLGIALEALKAASLHGTYLARLEALGISKSTADRCRQLACVREALPKNPPAELYGQVWTDNAALEFGNALLEMDDDIPADEKAERTVQKIRARRSSRLSSQLSRKVLTLENELTLALQTADPGAEQAVGILLDAARRLDRIAKDLADSAAEPR